MRTYPRRWRVLGFVSCIPSIAFSSTVQTFSVPGAADTYGRAINNDGVIAGEYQTPANVLPGGPSFGGSTGFVRMANGTLVTFDVPGSQGLNPFGINDLGQVVGLYVTSNGPGQGSATNAFLRNADGSISTLAPPPGFSEPIAFDINNAGFIVMDAGPNSFVRAPDGSFTQLTNDDWRIRAHAINNAGVIAGNYDVATETGCAPHGFVFASGTYTSFDVPGACGTTVFGLNDLGEVVIQAIVNGRPTYFVRSADGSRYDLIDVLAQASDINNSGVVVGAVLDMDNTFLGAFGTLPLTIPEPRSAVVSLLVLIAFLLRIQRIRV